MRVLIYSRVSQDPRGQGRSVQEQEAEARAWAGREGWDVVRVETETGSASRFARKGRDAWAAVLAVIEAREVDAILTWEASRAQRDPTAYAALRDACASAGVQWGYSGHLHDLAEREGRFRTGLDALLAEDEAARTSERVLRAVRANAVAGKPHGKNLYGYQRIYDPATRELLAIEPHLEQAPVVREIARRLIAGETSHAIAADLNRREVPPRRPVRETHRKQLGWTPVAVTEVARKPSYAGLRQHQGEIVGEAAWPALIEPEDWQKLQAVLDQRPPRAAAEWQVRYLLTGIAVCGECGGLLRKGHQNKGRAVADGRRSRYAVYICPGSPGRGGFHVSVSLAALDELVTELVLTRLSQPDATASLGAQDGRHEEERTELLEQIARNRGWLEQVRAAAAEQQDLTLWLSQEKLIKPRIEAAERELRSLVDVDTAVLDLADAGDARAAWDALDLTTRRRVVAGLLTPVVHRAERPGQRGRVHERVEVAWRV